MRPIAYGRRVLVRTRWTMPHSPSALWPLLCDSFHMESTNLGFHG